MNFKQILTKGAAPALLVAVIAATGAVPAVLGVFQVGSVPVNCTPSYGYSAGYGYNGGYGYGFESTTCITPPSPGGGSAYVPSPIGSGPTAPSGNVPNDDGINDPTYDLNDDGIEDTINNDISGDRTMTSIDGDLCKANSSGFDSETRGAYLYACVNNITTKRDINSSIFYGPVIRKEFAKMISNYAVNVLGLTPDTTKSCDFNDIALEDSEMKMYIKMACQLGVMGYRGNGVDKLDAFMPNQIVNRAQFGTVISRMLYDNQYSSSVDARDWYVGHLNALNSNGIINSINNPMMNEVRGYVWIVFERIQN